MKVYKRYSAARKQGGPILQLRTDDSIYVVNFGDDVAQKLTEILLIEPDGTISGNVTIGHLRRLGNANWAERGK